MRPGALRSLVGLVAEVAVEGAADLLRSHLPEVLPAEVGRYLAQASDETLALALRHVETVRGMILREQFDRAETASQLADIERERPD